MRAEDQERLVRIGPGTPAGTWLRRYWHPAILSTEAEADGAPVRVRLLGENLVAFRDSTGSVGLIDAYCAHRRAPLFLGRSEECGSAASTAGNFNRAGECIDLPSEPAASPMKADRRIKAYPTVEREGIVWAYLVCGRPRSPGAGLRRWTRAPATHRAVSKNFRNNNYLRPRRRPRYRACRLPAQQQHPGQGLSLRA